MSGPNVMQGYNNLPEASAEVFFDYDGKRYVLQGTTRLSDDTVTPEQAGSGWQQGRETDLYMRYF